MKRIGVVVPTNPEQAPLLELLAGIAGKEPEVSLQSIWRIYRVQIRGLQVSITRSGPGMVNAGAATEALVMYEQPEAVLNYGIAGSHIHEALPGDIIIGRSVCAPFNGYLQRGGVLNPAFGIRWDDEAVEAFGQGSGQPQRTTRRFSHLSCDHALASLALQAAQVLAEQHAMTIVAPPGQEERPARVYSGVIASADTYCRDEATFARIRDIFGPLCEDMESAAVGQVAARHSLPFAIIRCLSNNDLLEELTLERKQVIYPEMARRAALVTARFLEMVAISDVFDP